MQGLLKHIATLGPVGHIPFAPGTFGTLAAFVCSLIFPLTHTAHLILIFIGFIVGSFAATAAEKAFSRKDSRSIVIDEFVGYYVATLYIPNSLPLLIAAFALFRLFDIIKPLMIRKLELTLSRGMGVMADDILAGIYANMVLQIYLRVR
jgi:phosphatidylglycerophosphatase A